MKFAASPLRLLFVTLLAGSAASLSAGSTNIVVIDSFDQGWTSVTVGSAPTVLQSQTGFPHAGNMQFGLTSDAGILGEQRVGMVRDGHSGAISQGLSAIAISNGSASFYGNASAVEQVLYYGSAIDRDGNSPGTPVSWALALSTTHNFDFTIDQLATFSSATQPANLSFNFQTGAGNVQYSINGTTVGTHSISLAAAGFSPAQASSINGLVVSINTRGDSAAAGLQLSNIQFSGSAIPEPSSFATIAGLAVCGLAATRRRRV